MTNSINEISGADTIFAIGTNTTETHPVIAQQIIKAKNKGAKLIVADPRKTELAEKADIWLRPLPGTNVALLNGMAREILSENLHDEDFINKHTENFNEFKKALEQYTPEFVEQTTSIPAEQIKKAAKMYAEAGKAPILYTMGITQHTTGTDGVLSVANLAMLTGNVGKESSGVNPLRGQNNVQGACDMGGLPNVYTGYQKVGDPETRKKFSKAWGVELNEQPGLTVSEMMQAAGKDIKAMYVMGENPMLTDPNIGHVEEGLKDLDLLIVQDIFLTETAELADVVLPAASFAEKDGTFTNTERRVQRIRKALEPVGNSKPDWEIICNLAEKMGYQMKYSHPEEIMREINQLTPSYGGITYSRIEQEGLQWPCPSKGHSGTLYLHKDGKFPRGKGLFTPVNYRKPAETPDKEYPYVLTTGRILHHYHSVMTRKSRELNEEVPKGFMELNPEDADRLNVSEGEIVKVSSRRGEVQAPVLITTKVAPGVVYMSFHYKEMAANRLTNDAFDPKAKTPELKVSAVKIEKL